MRYTAIILAAGKGKRTALSFNKIFYKIHEKSLVDYSIDFFKNDEDCKQIILLVSKENIDGFQSKKNGKISHLILGGNTRQNSVYNSLDFIQEKYVFIHDAARPFLPKKSIQNMKKKICDFPSITLGVFLTDTIQRVEEGFVKEPLKREELIAVQTPQAFHKDLLVKAHQLAKEENHQATDDASLLFTFLGISTLVVEGDKRNIKFTTMEDLAFLEVILK